MKLTKQYPTTARPLGVTGTTNPTINYEGGLAFEKDAKTALYTLLVTTFAGEDTFYEAARDRAERLRELIAQVGQDYPEWTRHLIIWARDEGNIRTAPLMAAVEYARLTQHREHARQLISAVCQRADEPGEVLAYWFGRYGRKLPAAVKRGIADACVKLYNPRSAVKWDSARSPMRMGDVIELTHPKPKNQEQAALFRRLIDERHERALVAIVPEMDEYRAWIKAGAPLDRLPRVATWENVAGQRKMGREEWEAVIPKMGYMALLRNLRNFEEVGISRVYRDSVVTRLSDPAEVAKSRQLPFRFWSAWKHSGTMDYGTALETALELSTENIEPLSGNTLVMVDCSGSMTYEMSSKSKMTRAEAAGLFGAALHVRDPGVDLYLYDNGLYPVMSPRTSVLRVMDRMKFRGGATHTWPLTREAWNRKIMGQYGKGFDRAYDRIIIITDEQAYLPTPDYGGSWSLARRQAVANQSGNVADWVPANVPVYSWDLSGYKTTSFELERGRYQFAGLNDASFGLIKRLEAGQDGAWPWEYVS